MPIFTLGYEGLNPDRFVEIMHTHDIDCLVDVRQNPLSRKAGFSKNALCAKVEMESFEYRHIVALGCPRIIRDQYKLDKNWSRYTRDFSTFIKTQDAILHALLQEQRRFCLMCFEANALFCHRSLITMRMRQLDPNIEIIHLTAGSIVPYQLV